MTTNITEGNLFGRQEETGYDVPFTMFTWAAWLEMQTQTLQRFARFQRAIESRHIQEAAAIALENAGDGFRVAKRGCKLDYYPSWRALTFSSARPRGRPGNYTISISPSVTESSS